MRPGRAIVLAFAVFAATAAAQVAYKRVWPTLATDGIHDPDRSADAKVAVVADGDRGHGAVGHAQGTPGSLWVHREIRRARSANGELSIIPSRTSPH